MLSASGSDRTIRLKRSPPSATRGGYPQCGKTLLSVPHYSSARIVCIATPTVADASTITAKSAVTDNDAVASALVAPRITWLGEKWLIQSWSAADFHVSSAAQQAAMIRYAAICKRVIGSAARSTAA